MSGISCRKPPYAPCADSHREERPVRGTDSNGHACLPGAQPGQIAGLDSEERYSINLTFVTCLTYPLRFPC
jgi:hypothetical protein